MAQRALPGGGGLVDSPRARQRLVRRLAASGIRDQRVLDVIVRLPRHMFVDEALASRAYEDSALPIGHGQTISQPYTVARMTEALLEPSLPDTVLEIGTGSAFQTAVLASLVRRVYTIERISSLWDRAAERLRQLKLRNVRLRHGDGALGWPEYAPYDAILVTAAADGVPRLLAEQLAPGGCMVLPIETEGARGQRQVLLRVTRTNSGYRHQVLEAVTFVPLLGGIA